MGGYIICIYYNKDNLDYKKREHVFPAGIGGTIKLNRGTVSDQANELFSKYELEFMRDSIISLPRNLYGPGKRGSFNESQKTTSKIYVIEGESGLELSYIALGKPYSIVQFIRQGKNFHFILPKEDESKYKLDYINIKDTLSALFDTDKCKIIKIRDDRIPDDENIIGRFKDKIFVANRLGNGNSELVKKEVDLFCSKNIDIGDKKYNKIDNPKFNFAIKESTISSRVYAKTALNVLAYLLGDKFVMDKCFNDIKNWILDENLKGDFTQYIDKKLDLKELFPKNSHWCIVVNIENYLVAQVCFYNSIIKQVVLSNHFNQPFQIEGMVCDWENKKDYSLNEFLKRMI